MGDAPFRDADRVVGANAGAADRAPSACATAAAEARDVHELSTVHKRLNRRAAWPERTVVSRVTVGRSRQLDVSLG